MCNALARAAKSEVRRSQRLHSKPFVTGSKGPTTRGATALFPNMHGGRLSADGVQALLNKYVVKARHHCVSLRSKRVSPHVLRHSLTYLHAHLELKETALAKLKPYERVKAERFRPSDRLLEFLNAL